MKLNDSSGTSFIMLLAFSLKSISEIDLSSLAENAAALFHQASHPTLLRKQNDFDMFAVPKTSQGAKLAR